MERSMKRFLMFWTLLVISPAFAQASSTALQYLEVSKKIEAALLKIAGDQTKQASNESRTFTQVVLESISIQTKLQLFKDQVQSISVLQNDVDGTAVFNRNETSDRLWIRIQFNDRSVLRFTTSICPKFAGDFLKQGTLKDNGRIYFENIDDLKSLLVLFHDSYPNSSHDGTNVTIATREFQVSEYSSHLETAKEWALKFGNQPRK